MIKFDLQIHGAKEIQAQLAKISQEKVTEARNVLVDGILKINEEAKKSIQAHLSQGATYKRGSVVHTASLPGMPPNTDTGRLVQSIDFDIDTHNLVGRVGTNLNYGAWLEFGTKDVAPRPWLRPAFEKVMPSVIEAFKKLLEVK